jgi:hypothetical protein
MICAFSFLCQDTNDTEIEVNISPRYTVKLKILLEARLRWLTPIILATQEVEIRRIVVQSQLKQVL